MRCLLFVSLLALCLPRTGLTEDAPSKEKRPTAATPRVKAIPAADPKVLEASIKRGVDFLVGYQNPDGSWGNPTRTKGLNIYAPVPGAHHAFRTATTAMCIMALIESGSETPEVKQSLERAEQWLLTYLPRLRRATPTAIYNVWGHAYSIQALVRMHRRHDDAALRERLVELIESQFDLLDRYESVDGGWGYYDFLLGSKKPASSSISFVNATVLIAFHEAKSIGVNPPKKNVDKAIAALIRQRKPDFSYLYGEYLKDRPMRGINRPGGSLGRSQACNIALRAWGDEKIWIPGCIGCSPATAG